MVKINDKILRNSIQTIIWVTSEGWLWQLNNDKIVRNQNKSISNEICKRRRRYDTKRKHTKLRGKKIITDNVNTWNDLDT